VAETNQKTAISMKYLRIVPYLLMAIGCGTQEPKPEEPLARVGGKYQLVSLLSDRPIDADFDGVYSTDAYAEFNAGVFRGSFSISWLSSGTLGFLTPFPLTYEWPKEFQSDSGFYFETSTSGIVGEIDPADTSVVGSWWVGLPWLTDSSDMQVKKFEVIDDQTIRMLIYHDLIYDLQEEEWVSSNMEATYSKFQDYKPRQ
jgi:hypothetical protein